MVKTLVIAATGKQAGATARSLLKGGHEVHALVRNPESEPAKALEAQGAVLFKGNTDDIDSIKAAIAGTTAVFWVSLPSFTDMEEEVRGTNNIVSAAQESGSVKHLVYSTVGLIANIKQTKQWDANPFFKVYWENKIASEEAVRFAGLPYYTILRPAEFMSNFVLPLASFQFPDMTTTGVWNAAYPPEYLNVYIDTEDIGRVAAAAILDPQTWNRREVTLGADRITIREALELVSAAAGKELKLHSLGKEEALKAGEQNPLLLGQTVRQEYFEKFPELYEAPLEDFGLGFRTLKQFLDENKELVVETYKNVQ